MKKFQILGAVSGALVAGSLILAGPAAAHRGDAGDGSGAPGGQPSTSVHTDTEGQIGIGIFTNPAPAAGTEKPAGTVDAAPAYASRAAVGDELPVAPVGAAPAA